MRTNPFHEINASTATEFIDYLRLSNPIWQDADLYRGWRHGWLFRGQGLDSWPLLPSMWRTDQDSKITKLLNTYLNGSSITRDREFIQKALPASEKFQNTRVLDQTIENAFQLYCRTQIEVTLIASLLDQALLRGINIPDFLRTRDFTTKYLGGGPSYFVKQIGSNEFDHFDRDFAEVIHNNSLFALAQHHGIPTRLLDWTTSPYIAAFFAAEGALTKTDGKLAVFAAHESLLQFRGILNFPFPKSDNPFLHAQKGELTIYSGSSDFLFGGKYPTYPTVEHRLQQDADWSHYIPPIKITLPVTGAPELLRLLAVYEGIARDQLMPTFDNIVHVVLQRYEFDLSR